MAHKVEKMVYLGETPWHKLGVKLTEKLTAQRVLSLAGLDWKVSLYPAFAKPNGNLIEIPEDFQAVVRTFPDGKQSGLAVVGSRYTCIQNKEIAEWADALTEASKGSAFVETAGSLDHGRRVWFLMRVGNNFKVGKDPSPIAPFALLATSHDGSLKLVIKQTPQRVVCNNTLELALKGMSSEIQIRHTESSVDKLQKAIKAVKDVHNWYEKFADISGRLTETKFSKKQYTKLVTDLIAQGKEEKDLTTKAKNQIENLVHVYDKTPGQLEGTAWGAYQAITDYVDHERPSRSHDNAAESRLVSQTWGSGLKFKETALDVILQATKEQWEKIPPMTAQILDNTSKPDLFEIANNSKWS